ncbi:MAG TPA: radical SAM protein [Nannocystaceae bacterium]|nr:radical SAM protein [Nannocystaceae bacterium]
MDGTHPPAAPTDGGALDAEETVGFGQKRAQHEHAAHEVRNWVRLTFDCNDRCVFCLDADTHDGRIRSRDEVKAQILDGRRKGAERLILSGGEPTIHPDFVDFVRLGRMAGYAKVQTVTNGRMFAYREFLRRAIDAGLGEITFSLHGPDAKIHDALVGVKGAFDEEVAGLQHALDDGRPIVNIDVCVNRANVKHLGEMLRRFIAMGVREFDLLQVIPFGRAFREGKETLFYDLEEARPWLLEAFEYARRPDVHVWLNRFPVEHLEGFEELIQDPYKLNDEVRGRKPEYERWLDEGVALPCREPARCKHCYVRRLCDHLEETIAEVDANRFDVVRVDASWEARLPAPFGGDPASVEHAAQRVRLPIAGVRAPTLDLATRVRESKADTAWIVAADVAQAREVAARLGLPRAELELAAIDGVGAFEGLTRVRTRSLAQTIAALAIAGEFEVLAPLDRDHARWLAGQGAWPARLALVQPSYELASEASECDVSPDEIAALALRFADAPIEGVPACLLGRAPRAAARVLDTTMLAPDGGLEIFRYTRRFVHAHDRVKSLRCRACVHESGCAGVHVNWVRAHGFASLSPVESR